MRLFILLSGLSISSYAQMETLFVKAPNGDHYEAEFSFLKRHTVKMLIQGRATWATKYFGSHVKGEEDIMFRRNLVGGVKVSRSRKESNSGSANCTASEDVASIQDG